MPLYKLMSVYTDTLLSCVPNKNWRWNHSAHLFADTTLELHSFAAQIGLKRIWFQDEGFFPHYDLTARKHVEAVTRGAVLLTREQAMAKWHEILRRDRQDGGIEQRDSLNP
ncbi:MAG: DUF4031 domain-containing protein [Verrucomicrobiota bacterium]|jgi:hypothetical protein